MVDDEPPDDEPPDDEPPDDEPPDGFLEPDFFEPDFFDAGFLDADFFEDWLDDCLDWAFNSIADEKIRPNTAKTTTREAGMLETFIGKI